MIWSGKVSFISLSENEKEKIWNTWNLIIKHYKEDEIINNVSTNEYIYKVLKDQKMELTPLLVCYIKSIEQFLCAYIHYMTSKNLISQKNRLIGNWEESTCGLELENYILHNIHDYNFTKIGFDKYEEWKKCSYYWRTESRNGNLHKDNVDYKSDLDNYINGCINLFKATIKIANNLK